MGSKNLTLEKLKAMEPGAIIATGTIKNSPDGAYMTENRAGDNMRWVAKRGGIYDWAIYIHWAEKSEEYVLSSGDKVRNEGNIKKLVPCDKEAFEMYRY